METVEVVVGRVGRPHGLRGEVSVDLRTDEPDRRFVRGATLRAAAPPGAAGGDRTLTVAETRPHQRGLLVRFAELRDRTAAEAARGLVLHVRVPVAETPADPEEFYDHQLVGLAAHDPAGAVLGEVSAVLHGTAQDLLEIRTPSGRPALVPFVVALVPVVDPAGGRVVIADLPGLVAPDPEADG